LCLVARFDRRIVAADWIATQPVRLSYVTVPARADVSAGESWLLAPLRRLLPAQGNARTSRRDGSRQLTLT
jgi:hypothetical protein